MESNQVTLIKTISLIIIFTLSTLSYAQEGPRRGDRGRGGNPPPQQPEPTEVEQQLQTIVEQNNIQPITRNNLTVLPVEDAKVQLGKKLFFTKNLGGDQSVACVSCHHPKLGGGDDLSLSVGVSAVDQLGNAAHALLGQGRLNGLDDLPVVPRNAPTIFNLAFYQQGLFWDSRVQRLRNGGIATPDSIIDQQNRRRPDDNLPPNATLADAQARFPVTSSEEMRGQFLPDESNQNLRSALVSRLNNDIENISSLWPAEFAQVFGDQEVTVNRVFEAIGEYERSMIFIDSPWQQYLQGDEQALTTEQKQGAILFFTPSQQGGAGCIACHNGPSFTDERHHLVAFPQMGVGKGNISSTATSQDFGRENITGNSADRFHFRTPSLLNIESTAPYGHTGSYQTLEEVVAHYNNPDAAIDRLFGAQNNQAFSDGNAPFCQLAQVQELMLKNQVNCEQIFADAYENSKEVSEYLLAARNNAVNARAPFRARVNLNTTEISQVANFLRALTDPCVESEACLAPWLLNVDDLATFPDQQALEAVVHQGNVL